jgi:PhzF family phenazine biosynthesis protein
LDDWLDDQVMLKIAGESIAPATAFVIPNTDPLQLRWFTPVVEEELCGHGTLGAAWVVLNELKPDSSRAVFQTRAGQLTVDRADNGFLIDLPARTHTRVARSEAVDCAIGCRAAEHLTSAYHIAVMQTAREVAELSPDLGLVAQLDLPGLIVTAPGDGFDCDIVTRYFAPAKGIPEDHATGSAHTQIVPYWAHRLGKTSISARQLSPRGGAMICHHTEPDRIRLEAQAVRYLKGCIYV